MEVEMKFQSLKSLAAVFLLAGATYSHATEPLLLTESEMDSISAGTYSEVYGAATADSGSVMVKTNSQANIKPNGTQTAKSRVFVNGKGTGLEGYAYGESGDEQVVTTGEGAAATDQGRIRIIVRTKVKTKADGTSVSRTTTRSVASDKTTGARIVSTSTNHAQSM